MLEIRKAMKKDSKRILELLEYIFLLHYKNRNDLFEGNSKYNTEQINQLIVSEDYEIHVAEKDDFVIGYSICKKIKGKNNKKILYIDDLCVDSEHQNLGVGSEIMKYLKEFAIENDFDRIQLNVWEFNINAYEFYEKLGYSTQRREMEMILK